LDEVKRLVDADPDAINERGHGGCTCLHWAVDGGRLDIVAFLIGKGADVDSRDDHEWTPLHSAAWIVSPDLVEYLWPLVGSSVKDPEFEWTLGLNHAARVCMGLDALGLNRDMIATYCK
jgi:ankyrin repeat protein